MKSIQQGSLKTARRIAVGVLGFTVLLIGVAMIVLPGPAFIVIPVGLAILATEFVWARRLLKSVKKRIAQMGASSPGEGRGKGTGEGERK